MGKSTKDRISHVTPDGRTIVDVNALLRDPKVQETIRKLSRRDNVFRDAPNVAFVRYRKDGD